jgi:hypothetical protein
MSAPESNELSSDGNADAESHSPAATWQMWHTQMLRLGQQPSERKRRARHAFVGLVPLVSMLVTATILAQSAPLAQFGGRWSVLVITDQGDCSIYRDAVIVDHGRARYAGTADFTVDGSITSSGLVRPPSRAEVTTLTFRVTSDGGQDLGGGASPAAMTARAIGRKSAASPARVLRPERSERAMDKSPARRSHRGRSSLPSRSGESMTRGIPLNGCRGYPSAAPSGPGWPRRPPAVQARSALSCRPFSRTSTLVLQGSALKDPHRGYFV